ncbi:MAG: hypothetical protein M1540_03010 [Candidatus Bathyarchaeota archaeon]|nr:hypothetical protein [Candidatus Bathyarchaeota archaeon]
MACGGNCTAHTEADVENGCKPKTQPPPTAVVWCAVNQNTHIKSADKAALIEFTPTFGVYFSPAASTPTFMV